MAKFKSLYPKTPQGKDWELAYEAPPFRIGDMPTGQFYRESQAIGIYGSDGGGFLTSDGLTALICHEIGHMQIGESEGRADYYAASRCLPRLFENDDNVAIVSQLSVPKDLREACGMSYIERSFQAMCERIGMAAYDLWRAYHWGRCSKDPSTLAEQDPPTLENFQTAPIPGLELGGRYASLQCRLNTYISGAQCMEDRTPPIGNCSRSNGLGTRPSCSFTLADSIPNLYERHLPASGVSQLVNKM